MITTTFLFSLLWPTIPCLLLSHTFAQLSFSLESPFIYLLTTHLTHSQSLTNSPLSKKLLTTQAPQLSLPSAHFRTLASVPHLPLSLIQQTLIDHLWLSGSILCREHKGPIFQEFTFYCRQKRSKQLDETVQRILEKSCLQQNLRGEVIEWPGGHIRLCDGDDLWDYDTWSEI